eukprot:TRINITY_DN1499_c0_g1_i2.p1 TRINITY_DN1499_c0_g1~~TRINITY_DN1499_c0_g1_i2.p1  ORF type:complete len:1787 (+),score=222.01 TRINITY_DN1499_c0_g1_i2:70-5430(+)
MRARAACVLWAAAAVVQEISAANCAIASTEYSQCFEGNNVAGWNGYGAGSNGYACCSICASGCIQVPSVGGSGNANLRGVSYSTGGNNGANVFTTVFYSEHANRGDNGFNGNGVAVIKLRPYTVLNWHYMDYLYVNDNNLRMYLNGVYVTICTGCVPTSQWVTLEVLLDAPTWDKFRVCVNGVQQGSDYNVQTTGHDGIRAVDLAVSREDSIAYFLSAVWSTRSDTLGCTTCSTAPATPCNPTTASPTAAPTPQPTIAPTPAPTQSPIMPPTVSPTIAPSGAPSSSPSAVPTLPPTAAPSVSPTSSPTAQPTASPLGPSPSPSASPTSAPSTAPSTSPTAPPTRSPTQAPINPTGSPSVSPTASPTQSPLGPTPSPINPTDSPTSSPSASPTLSPTVPPSQSPLGPTSSPVDPTNAPSSSPSTAPTAAPTSSPSLSPIGPTPSPIQPTDSPSTSPTAAPTQSPLGPTKAPVDPTVPPSTSPTTAPSLSPTTAPSTSPIGPTPSPVQPTDSPSVSPTAAPTQSPLGPTKAPVDPTVPPSTSPTTAPSLSPTTAPSTSPIGPTPSPVQPTDSPSVSPTAAPTQSPLGPTKAPVDPTANPSTSPTTAPTLSPTTAPSTSPVGPTPSPVNPTISPSMPPTVSPSRSPVGPTASPVHPTDSPTLSPSVPPTLSPTAAPSRSPVGPSKSPVHPTDSPTVSPTVSPTQSPVGPSVSPVNPTGSPSLQPSAAPTKNPTAAPTQSPFGPTPAPAHPTDSPTNAPSLGPTSSPVGPTLSPSVAPSAAPAPPTASPTVAPAATPSGAPTTAPSRNPTLAPSLQPSALPSPGPSASPSTGPSLAPTLPPSRPPSRAPSAPPTLRPTDGPSTTPSLPPSGPPSRSPSRRPSVPPSLPPSDPPSVPPTAPPSQPPSVPPSQNPSAPPSWSPSPLPTVTPSGAPSPGPSVSPTLAPTTRPSTPPSQGPTVPPSTAPTVSPSVSPTTSSPSVTPTASAPSVSPTDSPTTPPSIQPSQAPTAPPQPAPTVSPTAAVDGADAVAGTTAAIGAGVSVATVNAAAVAQAGRLVLLASGCTAGDISQEDVPFAMHPTQLRISGVPLPQHTGCVLMTAVFVVVISGLQCGGAVLLSRIKKITLSTAQGALRCPTGSVIIAVLTMQGAAFCGARMIKLSSGDAASVGLGAVAVLGALLLPTVVLRFGSLGSRDAVFKLDRTTQGLAKWWLGAGEWLSLDDSWAVERFGGSFRAALPELHAVLAVDVLVSVGAMLSAGFGGGSCGACAVGRIADVALCLVFVTWLVLKRPYVRPVHLPLTVAGQVLLAAGAALLAVGFLSPECEQGTTGKLPGHAVAGILLTISGVFAMILAVLNAGAALRVMQLKRRPQLLEAVNRFRSADKSGEGLTAAQLHSLLEEQWQRTIGEEELQQIFKEVDTDCSGVICLKEFLASEKLFWGLGPGRERSEESNKTPLIDPAAMPRTVSAPLAAGGRTFVTATPRGSRGKRASPSFRSSFDPKGMESTCGPPDLTVAGAGLRRVDGVYEPVRGGGRRRRWRHRNGKTMVSTSPKGRNWVVVTVQRQEDAGSSGATDDGDVLYTAAGDGSGDVPPLSGWAVGPQGLAPAPHFTIHRPLTPSGAGIPRPGRSSRNFDRRGLPQSRFMSGATVWSPTGRDSFRAPSLFAADVELEELGDGLNPLPGHGLSSSQLTHISGTQVEPSADVDRLAPLPVVTSIGKTRRVHGSTRGTSFHRGHGSASHSALPSPLMQHQRAPTFKSQRSRMQLSATAPSANSLEASGLLRPLPLGDSGNL